jgi:hypothetical protein
MEQPRGNELYQLLIELAGLEDPRVENEILDLMGRLHMDPDELTTEDMRILMAVYLHEFQEKYIDSKPLLPDPIPLGVVGSTPEA